MGKGDHLFFIYSKKRRLSLGLRVKRIYLFSSNIGFFIFGPFVLTLFLSKGNILRVALWYRNNDIRIVDRPTPKIGPGEILMKVRASGICGTDVMEWYRIDRAPLVLGHEVAGEVVEVGEGVLSYKVGDRIVAAHHVSCNSCSYCFSGHETVCDTLRSTSFDPGGFSEYIRLPRINVEKGVFKLTDDVSYDEGTFVEPLACVLRGQKLAGQGPGKSVFVIGSGISGLLHIKLAAALGSGAIMASDISDHRLKKAVDFGAKKVFKPGDCTPSNIREANNGRLADIVIICAGAPAVTSQALSLVERGGTVLFFAAQSPDALIDVPINDIFWRSEVTLTSSYAGSQSDHETALELIRSGRLDVKDMITGRIGLEDIEGGFKQVLEADISIKIIVDPKI